MEYGEYKRLYDGRNGIDDIQRFIDEGYDRRLLETLYTQKVNRMVKKRFHAVKSKASQMLKAWKKGETICQIADRYNFPPMLVAMMIFQHDGCGRQVFWEYVRDPDLLDSPETAAELREATEKDGQDIVIGIARNKGYISAKRTWEYPDGVGRFYLRPVSILTLFRNGQPLGRSTSLSHGGWNISSEIRRFPGKPDRRFLL